MKKNGRKLL